MDVTDPIRQPVAPSIPGGWHTIEWDGRNDRGAAAGAGVYFATLRVEGERRTQRLVLLR